MDKKTTTKFRSFLNSRGAGTMFFGFYKEYRLEDNPEDVNEYLNLVPAKHAIAWSMDYEKIHNPQFGAKYWNDLDQKWKLLLDDKRSDFTVPGIDKAMREIKKEEKAAAQTKATASVSAPTPKTKETRVVENDWSGMMDLVEVKTNATRKSNWQQPDENEVRLTTKKNRNCMVFNSEVSKICDDNNFDSMSINVDRITNELVLVFGIGFDFNVRMYSADTKVVQHKALGDYLKKYIGIEFDPEKAYFIKVAKRVWNKAHTRYAIVLSQKYTTKDF